MFQVKKGKENLISRLTKLGSRNEKSSILNVYKEEKRNRNLVQLFYQNNPVSPWRIGRDNKEGIEARVSVKKRKNTSMDTCSTEFLFFCLLPFSLSPSLLQRKKKRTLTSYMCISKTFARTKKHTLKKTRTRIAFFTWIYIPSRTLLRIIIPRGGNWILPGKKRIWR